MNSNSSRYDAAVENRTATINDIRNDLTHVMADMGSLRGRLQGDFRSNYAVSDLQSYLDEMQLHATNLGHRFGAGRLESPEIPRKATAHGPRHPSSGTNSSSGDAPDSAIDMNDGPPSPYQSSPKDSAFSDNEQIAPDSPTLPAPPLVSSLPIVEIEEFLDELHDGGEISTRPPTPPPKARARARGHSMVGFPTGPGSSLAPILGDGLLGLSRPSSARSLSVYSTTLHDSEGNPIVPPQLSLQRSPSGTDGDDRSTLGSLKGIRPPFSESDYGGHGASRDRAIITTTIIGGAAARGSEESSAPPPIQDFRIGRSDSRLFGRKNSFSVPGQMTRSGSSSQGKPRRSSSLSRGEMLLNILSGPGAALAAPASRVDAVRAAASPRTSIDLPSGSTELPATAARRSRSRQASAGSRNSFSTQGSASKTRPSTSVASGAAASVRSSGSKVSSVFKRMSFWKPKIEEEPIKEEPEPDDIFGVSLKKSIQMASSSVRTHHDGSKASSRREFPRCILLCVSFIKDNHGTHAPNIFGGEMSLGGGSGDHGVRVTALKEGFSTGPRYGEGNIDWSQYDVYDAAELIVTFLQQLPKPLISETVAKRWIVMSKQATLPGSMGLRLDSCIDFWDEALLGVRGAARSLFKLLLNLWGDIADAADVNDMTAERLASRLLNPLMHLPAGKYTTDYMLGLAFLIRKRSEYAIMLREGRKSHAAFR